MDNLISVQPPLANREIERKFLTTSDAWRTAQPGERLVQGYLTLPGGPAVVRVRTSGSGAFLTIKGRGAVERAEYEYPIAAADAGSLLHLTRDPLIQKTRYRVPHGDHVWEVDEFQGANAGLVVAEVELAAADEQPALPRWVGREISDDPRYTNSALSDHPFTTWASPADDLIQRALAFAVRAHGSQTRKGTRTPYVTHPVRVAASLISVGCDAATAAAAYLHDTLEDTKTTRAELLAEFGEEVAGLVSAASEPDKGATWEVRKQHTIDTLATMPRRELWVPVADKIDNAESILAELGTAGVAGDGARGGDASPGDGNAVWERFSQPISQQAWYYRSMVAGLRQVADAPPVDPGFALLVARLERVVSQLFGAVAAASPARPRTAGPATRPPPHHLHEPLAGRRAARWPPHH